MQCVWPQGTGSVSGTLIAKRVRQVTWESRLPATPPPPALDDSQLCHRRLMRRIIGANMPAEDSVISSMICGTTPQSSPCEHSRQAESPPRFPQDLWQWESHNQLHGGTHRLCHLHDFGKVCGTGTPRPAPGMICTTVTMFPGSVSLAHPPAGPRSPS